MYICVCEHVYAIGKPLPHVLVFGGHTLIVLRASPGIYIHIHICIYIHTSMTISVYTYKNLLSPPDWGSLSRMSPFSAITRRSSFEPAQIYVYIYAFVKRHKNHILYIYYTTHIVKCVCVNMYVLLGSLSHMPEAATGLTRGGG